MMRTATSCLAVVLAIAATQARANEARFVVAGVQQDACVTGADWTTKDGSLVCSGTGNILYAGKRLGPGDFVVQAELTIDMLGLSAASFVINDSHFGFEGSNAEMFTHGKIFAVKNLGQPVVKEGVPFAFLARRVGNQLSIEIDGRKIHSAELDGNTVCRVGLRPWRSTMRLTSFSATGNLQDPPPPLPSVAVVTSGTGGYHTYRIPAIIATKKGTLLAFCEGRKGSRSDTGDIDMLVSRSGDSGKTWSKPLVIWDDGGNTCGNPCPVVDQQSGVVWLLMTWNLGSDHESEIMQGTSADVRHAYVTHSDDDGVTWTPPVKISDQVRRPHWRWYATGPGNAIQLTRGPHKGRLLIPANHSDHSDPEVHPYRAHVFWSDDHGATWQLGGIAEPRTNESAAVELQDGSILLSMRSYHGHHNRAAAISTDGGAAFGPVRLDDALQTPVCQGNILRYSWPDEGDGKSRILFSSPAGTERTELTVRLSYDEGQTWPAGKLIYEGGSAYSNLIALPDRRIGVLCEKDDYRTISLVTFTLDWLER